MSDIPKLQARLARVIEAYGANSHAAQKARERLQAAIHEDLAKPPVVRVPAVTERRV